MSAEPLSFRPTRQLGRWLSVWGVDADQYHWLLQASLRMDFRPRSSVRGNRESSRTRSALIMTGVMYVIFSLMLAVSLRAAGVGTFSFAVVMFGYSMAMMAMSILIEFGMVVISPDDFLILAHRPVSSRTFFAVKCSNLLFYTLLLDLSLNLAPAFIGWTFKEAPWHFPLVYLGIATLAGVFVVAVVAALYGLLLQRINYERFKDLLAWCQILFSFMFFFGYQLIPRLMGRVHGFRVEDAQGIVAGLPPLWFASLNELALGHFSWFAASLSLLALLTMGILLPGLLRSVSLDYSDRIGGMVTAAVNRGARNEHRKSGSPSRCLERLSSSNQEERALFGFLLKMFRRNRQLKLQLYPNFGIVIALFVLAVMDHENLGDPLAGGQMGFASIFPLMAFLFAGVGFTSALPYSDEYQGAWIFQIAPITRPERFLRAIKKVLFLVLFLPLFLLNVILFGCFWPLTHAVGMSLYGLAIGLATFEAMLFRFKVFPFSQKPAKGTQSRRLATVFVMMIAYGIFMALPSLFAAAPGLLAGVVLLLFGTAAVLGGLTNRAYARAIRKWGFEAE
jgi:hypothetical protein